MNCLENLPIYTAIVVTLLVTGVTGPILDALAITILVARICQSSIHMALAQTNAIRGSALCVLFRSSLVHDRHGRHRCSLCTRLSNGID